MKKLVVLIAIVAFIGVTAAPVNAAPVLAEVEKVDDKKADKKTEKKATKKADTKATAKSDCSTKSPCQSTCGDKKTTEDKKK